MISLFFLEERISIVAAPNKELGRAALTRIMWNFHNEISKQFSRNN